MVVLVKWTKCIETSGYDITRKTHAEPGDRDCETCQCRIFSFSSFSELGNIPKIEEPTCVIQGNTIVWQKS